MVNQTRQPVPLWKKILRLAEDGDVAVKDESAAPVIVKTIEIGSSGTESYGGYTAEEYLSSLRGSQRADIFDQMRRSDPQIKMILNAVKNPIKAASWAVEPGDDTPEAKADAELVEQILFKDIAWKQFLNEALTVLEFGFAPFEITHKVVLNSRRFGSYNSLRKLGWRSPKTIERFHLDSSGGLEKLAQYAYGDTGKIVDIPAQFLLLFTLDREGSNYEGISALRPCYGSWFRKNTYLKLNAIGIEKAAVPTPIGKYPAGAENSKQYLNFVNVLKAYTTHQANYITIPEGWSIELNNNTFDPQKVEISIDNEDKRMVKAFLANFLELGMNGSGAYALSNDLSDFFLGGIEHIAGLICEGINQDLIPNLVKMNRGPRETYPVLKASGISDKAGKELAEVLEILVRAGLLDKDDLLVEHVRRRFNLPKKVEVIDTTATTLPAGAPAAASAPAGDQVDASKTAMNGAQVESLMNVVSQVALNQIPRETAIGIMGVAFNLTPAQAEQVLGAVGQGFKPAALPKDAAASASMPASMEAKTLAERVRLARRRRMDRAN